MHGHTLSSMVLSNGRRAGYSKQMIAHTHMHCSVYFACSSVIKVVTMVRACVHGPGDEYCALLAAAGDQCIGNDHAEGTDGSV